MVSRFLEANSLVPLFILLTHGHFDHISGVKVLREKYDIPVFIHQGDSAYVDDMNPMQENALSAMGFEEFAPFVRTGGADEFLKDGETLLECYERCGKKSVKLGTEEKQSLKEWVVMHTPGHSQGSVCVYSQSQRTLIAGDTVFYHSWGRTDLPGGNEGQIQKSLRRIYHDLPKNTLVYSGHDYCGFCLEENL